MDPIDYPFGLPQESYLWKHGEVLPLESFGEADRGGRIAVLAIGSNASPRQLNRKFLGEPWMPEEGPECEIAVTKVTVVGVDVVYAAHLAGYGSIPATVVDSPGTKVSLFVTWLTDRQFERMNETERLGSHYVLRAIGDVEDDHRVLESVYCYVAKKGAALLGDGLLALDGIAVENGLLRRGDQRRAWDLVAADMSHSTDMSHSSGPDLLASIVKSDLKRQEVASHLLHHRVPLAAQTIEVLPVISGTELRHHKSRNYPSALADAST
ncbi:MAG TPA: hypothetical protein VHU17_21800 [Acidimicrobiales bacterium]|jgi:hypothetical protein|nr:hypothetical protein [Acidimicrobiales bacterium]